MLASLARLFLLRRLFGARSRARGSGRRPGRYGYGQRRRSSGFGMMGPFPSYSRRSRRGVNVSVGGCCLPIPLALTVMLGGAFRMLARR
jgi:hypothetical protein